MALTENITLNPHSLPRPLHYHSHIMLRVTTVISIPIVASEIARRQIKLRLSRHRQRWPAHTLTTLKRYRLTRQRLVPMDLGRMRTPILPRYILSGHEHVSLLDVPGLHQEQQLHPLQQHHLLGRDSHAKTAARRSLGLMIENDITRHNTYPAQ